MPHPPPHQQQQQQQQPGPVVDPSQVQQVKDMFPDIDNDVIEAVLQSTGGNVDQAISQLLQMNDS